MHRSCNINGVNTDTLIKITYVESPGTPAIPAAEAPDENPATPAIPAKDAVYVTVSFKELLMRNGTGINGINMNLAQFHMKMLLNHYYQCTYLTAISLLIIMKENHGISIWVPY